MGQSGKARVCLSLVCFALIMATFACGFGLRYERDLTGKYAVWAIDEIEQASIVKKSGSSGTSVVGPMVFAYGWNNKFIIVQQHPWMPDSYFAVNMAVTNWFIVETKSGKVHGPLSEQKYMELRRTLGVPASVTFTETLTPSQLKTPSRSAR